MHKGSGRYYPPPPTPSPWRPLVDTYFTINSICLAHNDQPVGILVVLRGDISENHFSFIIFHPRKISCLMTELQALKQEKGDTEEARKMAEEEIAKMKKDHEEKVLIFVSSRFLLLLCVLFIDYYYRDFFVWTE